MDYIPPIPSEDENIIFASMEKGINFSRYNDIKVKMTGNNVPANITWFIFSHYNIFIFLDY